MLGYKKEQRVVYERRSGHVVLGVQKDNNVLVVQVNSECERGELRDVLMAILGPEGAADAASDIQGGTLAQFHTRLDHLSYDTIELMAKDPRSDIRLSDVKRANCLTCALGKQTKNA